MKTNIREASAEDYEPISNLFNELDAIHRDNLPHIFKQPDGPVRELDYYLGLISDESVGLFVAEFSGYVVGFVNGLIKDTPAIPVFVPRRHAVVDSIIVKSGYKSLGIGRSLMDKIQEWSIKKGAISIEINVYEFNSNAISFYEKCGYKTFSRRMYKK